MAPFKCLFAEHTPGELVLDAQLAVLRSSARPVALGEGNGLTDRALGRRPAFIFGRPRAEGVHQGDGIPRLRGVAVLGLVLLRGGLSLVSCRMLFYAA